MNSIACILIRLYQLVLSPILTTFFGSQCRFEPTCSEYGFIAFKKYPFCKALKLTARRLSKCHPGGSHGYDPVP